MRSRGTCGARGSAVKHKPQGKGKKMSNYDYHHHRYHHNRKRKKIFTLPVIISIVLVLALGAVIGTIIAVDRARTRAEEEILRQFNEETKELVLERQRLMLEYDNVEKYMLDRKADGSYLGIVFTEIDDELYHHVYPDRKSVV